MRHWQVLPEGTPHTPGALPVAPACPRVLSGLLGGGGRSRDAASPAYRRDLGRRSVCLKPVTDSRASNEADASIPASRNLRWKVSSPSAEVAMMHDLRQPRIAAAGGDDQDVIAAGPSNRVTSA